MESNASPMGDVQANAASPNNQLKPIYDPQHWYNWHDSINVGGEFEGQFFPRNADSGFPFFDLQDQDFQTGLQGLIKAVEFAWAHNKSIRAYGSKWSLDNIAFNDQYMVNTWNLNYCKSGVSADHLHPDYPGKGEFLCFVQAGVNVKQLNLFLAARKQALSTTGASDGQRLVGAVSTGTHGSANAVGAMQDYVRAIHLVVPDDQGKARHLLIQPATNAPVNAAYAQMMGGAELITDDDLFYAAEVSFGSFGLIHGLLIETEPLYKLDKASFLFKYPEVQPLLQAGDPATLARRLASLTQDTDPEELPFHFEVSLNPYRTSWWQSPGAFVRILKKFELPDGDPGEFKGLDEDYITGSIHELSGRHLDDLGRDFQDIHFRGFPHRGGLRFLGGGNWLELLLALFSQRMARRLGYSLLIQLILRNFFKVPRGTDEVQDIVGFPYQFFSSPKSTLAGTTYPVPGTSLEVSIPLAHWQDAVSIILRIVNKDPLAAPMGMRLVRPSKATMAFTRFGELTATIELPGPFGKKLFNESGRIHTQIFEAFHASGLPHAFHWGQQMPKNNAWIPKQYGDAVEKWQSQRSRILTSDQARKMFANQLTTRLGLT